MSGGAKRRPRPGAAAPRPRERPAAVAFEPRQWWLAAAAALLALVVHRRVLGAYFVPDDFLQLARAQGLLEWPVSSWRWLSGYALGHATFAAFGTEPWPYHALNLGLLALATALLFALARRWGASPAAAFAAAALFGASRVHFTALVAASWTSEFLSLALLLAALLVAGSGARRAVAAALLLVAAVSAKESVMLLPLVLLLPAGAAARLPGRRTALALLAVGLAAGAAFVADGQRGGRFAGDAYETAFGGNLAAALFTLLRWSVDLVTPIPDLVTNPDPGAWTIGLPVLLALAAVAFTLRTRAPIAALGVAWWLVGVLPVLPLVHQTYLHYLVTPGVGLALVLAGVLDAWVFPAVAGRPATGRGPARALAVAAALVLAGAFVHERLLEARWSDRLPGGDTPRDPVLRKSEYARRIIGGTSRALGGRRANVAYFVLEGAQQHLDLRTGANLALAPEDLGALRNSVEATLADGTPLRALVPGVDTVVFVRQLENSLRGFDCFLPNADLRVQHLGRPPEALELLAKGLVNAGLPGPAAGLLEVATREWPGRPALVWTQAVALARLGERDRARELLGAIVRSAPADSFAVLARAALASEPAAAR